MSFSSTQCGVFKGIALGAAATLAAFAAIVVMDQRFRPGMGPPSRAGGNRKVKARPIRSGCLRKAVYCCESIYWTGSTPKGPWSPWRSKPSQDVG
jgi:hypothetical protein